MSGFFKNNFKYVILAGVICVPLFGHLGSLPIHLWDESRLTMNAYEMYNNKNWIVTFYEGAPDLWNTKPPFLIWCQALLMGVVGPNELAIRLPSAIAGLLTCLAIVFFSNRYLKNFWVGFISVVILITSRGYISDHGTRTGDYDAMLTLFTTLYCFSFFAYSETKKVKYLYFFFISMTLGVLTKSVAALFFTPAIFIFVLMQKQLFELLKNKHFYFGLGIFLFFTFGYYLLREMVLPGYLDAVYMNDLGGRFFEAIENHKQDSWFYYDNIISSRFTPWYLFLPFGILTGALNKDERIRKLSLYFGLLILTYFIVISGSETKLDWYDLPLYPFIALLTSLFLYLIFDVISKIEFVNQLLKYNFLPFAFVFFISINPYRATIDRVYLPKPKPGSWQANYFELSYYMRDAIHGKHDVSDNRILYEEYNAQLQLYVKVLRSKGQVAKFIGRNDIQPNTLVLVQDDALKEYLTDNFKVEKIEVAGNVIKYKVHEQRR